MRQAGKRFEADRSCYLAFAIAAASAPLARISNCRVQEYEIGTGIQEYETRSHLQGARRAHGAAIPNELAVVG